MRRILGIVLSCVLAFSLFVGCSSDTTTKPEEKDTTKESATEEINLSMTVWGSEKDVEAYQERLDMAAEKYPETSVELIYIPQEYDQKVQTMIAGGTAPDIMQVAEKVHGFSTIGQIVSLNDYIAQKGIDLDNRFGTSYKTYTIHDNTYALPDRSGAMIMYYNKDMFDEAGIEYPTEKWGWEELLAAAQAMTKTDADGNIEQYGFAASGDTGSWWPWWMSFIYQNDGRIIDEEGNVTVNSDEVKEALQFYKDLMYEYKVSPTPGDLANLGAGGPDPVFAQGKVAMILTGFWNVGSLQSVEGLNWDIAPVFGNATCAFGSGLSITSDSENIDEAFNIIDFMTDEEAQMVIVNRGQDVPANVAVQNSDAFLNSYPIRMDTFAISSDFIFSPPTGPWWNELLDTCKYSLDPLWIDEVDVEEAVTKLDEELKALMERY